MPDPHPFPPNIFAGSPLDRADGKRRDADWLAAQRAATGSRLLPVWRSRNLLRMTAEGEPRLASLSVTEMAHFFPHMPWALLGEANGVAWFAMDLSSLDDPPAGNFSFEDLRRVGADLPAPEAAMLAHARGLMHWRTRHRFCGVCGAACIAAQAGHVMICLGCGTHHFPRTDPAVIMLVTRGEKVLLGHPARFPDRRIFTVLAGFVEPGETLEEAVAREVFEETSVRVETVRYLSSQPWPFPSSIMLGFRADAVTEEIVIDQHEIAEAGWFTRAQVRAPEDFVLPPPMSIARRLIDDWVAE